MRLSSGCGGAEAFGETVGLQVVYDGVAELVRVADAGVGGSHRSNELATRCRLSSG